MNETPPLTPLTKNESASAPLSGRQVAEKMAVAILIWLVTNIIVFVAASFLIFILLSSTGAAQEQEAFTLAILCAIPLALTASGLLAGRRIYYTLSRHNR
jgi:hypothetical protein